MSLRDEAGGYLKGYFTKKKTEIYSVLLLTAEPTVTPPNPHNHRGMSRQEFHPKTVCERAIFETNWTTEFSTTKAAWSSMFLALLAVFR